MTIYSLDVLLFLFGTNLLFHVQFCWLNYYFLKHKSHHVIILLKTVWVLHSVLIIFHHLLWFVFFFGCNFKRDFFFTLSFQYFIIMWRIATYLYISILYPATLVNSFINFNSFLWNYKWLKSICWNVLNSNSYTQLFSTFVNFMVYYIQFWMIFKLVLMLVQKSIPNETIKVKIFVNSTLSIWRRKWEPTLVFLPGKFHGQRAGKL